MAQENAVDATVVIDARRAGTAVASAAAAAALGQSLGAVEVLVAAGRPARPGTLARRPHRLGRRHRARVRIIQGTPDDAFAQARGRYVIHVDERPLHRHACRILVRAADESGARTVVPQDVAGAPAATVRTLLDEDVVLPPHLAGTCTRRTDTADDGSAGRGVLVLPHGIWAPARRGGLVPTPWTRGLAAISGAVRATGPRLLGAVTARIPISRTTWLLTPRTGTAPGERGAPVQVLGAVAAVLRAARPADTVIWVGRPDGPRPPAGVRTVSEGTWRHRLAHARAGFQVAEGVETPLLPERPGSLTVRIRPPGTPPVPQPAWNTSQFRALLQHERAALRDAAQCLALFTAPDTHPVPHQARRAAERVAEQLVGHCLAAAR